MKNLVKNIIKKISMDYQSGGKGNILLQNMSLKHEGRKMTFKSLSVNWDFKNFQVNVTEGGLTSKGKCSFSLKIEELTFTYPTVQGEFGLGFFEASAIEDLQNLLLILPTELVAMGRVAE